MCEQIRYIYVDEDIDEHLRAAFKRWYAAVYGRDNMSNPEMHIIEHFRGDIHGRLGQLGAEIQGTPVDSHTGGKKSGADARRK